MKTYSVGAKKRTKRSIQRHDASVEEMRVPIEQDDPLSTARFARCNHTGLSWADASDAIYSEQAGIVIARMARNKQERDALWRMFLEYDAADNNHCRRVIGRPRFPNVAKMEILPERFETRPDDRADTRTDDEKHRAAVNAWAEWQRRLARLTGPERYAIETAARHRADLVKDRRPTTAGTAFVAALRVLRAVVDTPR